MTDSENGIRIGLALSGGTARSVCHVGVIRALLESGIRFQQVAGTSGGGIVAACFAAGIPVDRMENIANEMSWGKLATLRFSRWGFVSSRRIEKMVREIIGGVGFDELQMPCAVVTTDFASGDSFVFTEGPVARAVRASCSLPQIFLPVEINGRYYVDGGLSEYLPVDSVRNLGADFVVAVNLGNLDSANEPPRHLIQIAMQFINIMARRNMEASLKKADFVIEPDLAEFGQLDFSVSEQVIERGYRTALGRLGPLQEALAHHAAGRAAHRRRSEGPGGLGGRLRSWLRRPRP